MCIMDMDMFVWVGIWSAGCFVEGRYLGEWDGMGLYFVVFGGGRRFWYGRVKGC